MPDFWQCLTERSYLLESGTGLLEVIARLIADLFFATPIELRSQLFDVLTATEKCLLEFGSLKCLV